MNSITKKCNKCGKVKLVVHFPKDKQKKDGLYPDCKICHNKYNKKWCDNNREKVRETVRRWKKNNPEKVREESRIYWENNREKHSENSRNWYNNNRKKLPPIRAAWRKNNPDKVRAIKHRYRARKAGGGGSFTEKEWQELCANYDYRCLCCGEKKPLEADHVMPVAKGGTSNIDNIQPLCKSCNTSKRTKIVDYRHP
jgi:5-methylcytosine-specific restriction endonuclease McrA